MKTQGTWISQNNPEKGQQSWRTQISQFQILVQSYRSQGCARMTQTWLVFNKGAR